MYNYGQCPRCGCWSVEHLRSHSHCWECNYFPEHDPMLMAWQDLEFRKSKISEQRRHEEARIYGGLRTVL